MKTGKLLLVTVALLLSALAPITTKAAGAQGSCDSIFGTPVLSTPKISAAECDALEAIYNSTNGPSWWFNDGWDIPANALSTDPCTWRGVTCQFVSAGGVFLRWSVTKVELISNNLTGTLPTEIGNLTRLTTMSLGSNQLSGPIPTEIGNLTRLAAMSLNGNQLSGPIPAEIGNLTQPCNGGPGTDTATRCETTTNIP